MLDYNSNNLVGMTPGAALAVSVHGGLGTLKREYSKAKLLTTPRSERQSHIYQHDNSIGATMLMELDDTSGIMISRD